MLWVSEKFESLEWNGWNFFSRTMKCNFCLMKFKHSFRRLDSSYRIFRISCRFELCFYWFNWLKICHFQHFLSLLSRYIIVPLFICIQLHFLFNFLACSWLRFSPTRPNGIANMIVIFIWYCHVKFILIVCRICNLLMRICGDFVFLTNLFSTPELPTLFDILCKTNL